MSEDKLEVGQIRIDEEGNEFEVLIIGDQRSFFKYLHNGAEDARLNDDLLEYTSLVKPERKEIEMNFHWHDSGNVFQVVKGSRDDTCYGNNYIYKKLELIDGKFYEAE